MTFSDTISKFCPLDLLLTAHAAFLSRRLKVGSTVRTKPFDIRLHEQKAAVYLMETRQRKNAETTAILMR